MRIYNLLKDFLLPKEVLYLQDDDSFNLALRDLEANNILAIDTEFIWRNTYFPKLSLIQISTYKKIYIIDCITLNISELEKIFINKKILKIFHSIRGDISVLSNCLGFKIENIFDTQLAEDILSQRKGAQISYKKLVNKYFFKDISKSENNSDWERRPLKKKQVDYAAEDVRYLHSIMEIQKNKLISSNKIDSFYLACHQEKKLGEEDFSISRLRRFQKKNKNISKKEIEVFNWRENQAKKLNVPPSHIIEDKNLKQLQKVMEKKDLNECKWIIKKDSSRDDFINFFL